jgi:hypothetical protein
MNAKVFVIRTMFFYVKVVVLHKFYMFFTDDDLYKVVPGVLSGVKVVSVGETEAVLTEFHSSGIGGHSGFNKTNDAIKIRYWWPKMTSDVRDYVCYYRLVFKF